MIINPNSGPGGTPFPGEQYAAAVEKLSTYDNALMVGYVRTGYATRNISTVIAEVDTYAGWSSNSSALTLHGIFFDEAPYVYSEQAVDFMRTVNQVVKNSTSLQGPKLVSASLLWPPIAYPSSYVSVLLVRVELLGITKGSLSRINTLRGTKSWQGWAFPDPSQWLCALLSLQAPR